MVEQTISAIEAGNKRATEDIERLKRQFQQQADDRKKDKMRDTATIDQLSAKVKTLEEEKQKY